jgi:hypothetical protein
MLPVGTPKGSTAKVLKNRKSERNPVTANSSIRTVDRSRINPFVCEEPGSAGVAGAASAELGGSAEESKTSAGTAAATTGD